MDFGLTLETRNRHTKIRLPNEEKSIWTVSDLVGMVEA